MKCFASHTQPAYLNLMTSADPVAMCQFFIVIRSVKRLLVELEFLVIITAYSGIERWLPHRLTIYNRIYQSEK